MTFNAHTTTQEWLKFLEHMTDMSSNFDPKLLIVPKLTMFHTRVSKNLWIDAATMEGDEALLTGEWDKKEQKSYIQNWSLGLTLSGFLWEMRSYGTLAVFTNTMGGAVEAQSQKVMDWHIYAVFYKGGILAVYDPNFVAGTEKLDTCTGVPLLKGLIRALCANSATRKVTQVWFGGGTNQGIHCQEMTRAWIEDEIVAKRGGELGIWENREGWVRLRF